MNIRLTRCLTRLTPRPWSRAVYALTVLAALAFASVSTMAQSFVDTDPELYRCAVLGDTRACRQPESRPPVWYEERVELGPIAQSLRHLGADPQDAIAQARLRGEEPMRRVMQVVRIPLSPEQAYARAMGQRLVPDEARRTISLTPALETRPLLHDDWSASLRSPPSSCAAGPRPNGQDGDAAPVGCRELAGRAE